jgi:hypothetical protein
VWPKTTNLLLASLASSVGDIQSTMLTMSRGSHEKEEVARNGGDDQETDGATYSSVDLVSDS